jgi:DNA repair exonuclease SbcCD ATPase subunit
MCASSSGAAALLVLALAAPAAFAQSTPSREQELIRRLRQQVQQLQQAQGEQQQAAQKSAADSAAAQKRAEAALADAGRARGAASSQARSLAELRTERDTLVAERDALQQQLDAAKAGIEQRTKTEADLRAEAAQRQTLLATRESTFADLWRRHQAQAQGLQACIASNAKLHALGLEFLDRYEKKGAAELWSQQEPFVQTGRVKLENLLQGYREQLDQSALKPASGRGS